MSGLIAHRGEIGSQRHEAVALTREAAGHAFGNRQVTLEKLLEHPRHVEIQASAGPASGRR